MSVQNAGAIIREARLKAGLTQAQLAEGVCSVLSLSRIENGSAGVCPSTFQALMAHAGVATEAYPAFANRTDFDCFYTLKQARFYLDSWQLQFSYDKLQKVEALNWSSNKFYYQEWLLLHCKLQFRSGCGDHAQIYDTLMYAIHISRPDFNSADFRNLLLSLPEIELFTLLAQEALYLGNPEICLEICTQIASYLANSQMDFLEKDRLAAENAIVYTKYLIATKDYENALKTADYHRHQMAQRLIDSPILELTFLTALNYYYINDKKAALTYFKMAFLSAHAIGSCYATICHNFVKAHLSIVFPDTLSHFKAIPLISYPQKKTIGTASMSDGTYDLFSSDVLTLGSLIRELRVEQKLSQTLLCQGLCSKSKLSKIENETLQPEIILAQALLQRLGISGCAFTFFGNTRESRLQEFQSMLVKTRSTQPSLIQFYIREIETLCTPKDTLYLQFILSERAYFEDNSSTKIKLLHEAIALTLPCFDINQMNDYRLSWNELCILNDLCNAYADANPIQGILYFYKLCEYCDNTSLDVLEKKRFFPVTLGRFVRHLYRGKRFTEIKSLVPAFHSAKSSLYFTGNIFAHYCQTLGELNEYSDAVIFSYYAYYLLLTVESDASASIIKESMYNDFQIDIL